VVANAVLPVLVSLEVLVVKDKVVPLPHVSVAVCALDTALVLSTARQLSWIGVANMKTLVVVASVVVM
jgi:hypothetical protein